MTTPSTQLGICRQYRAAGFRADKKKHNLVLLVLDYSQFWSATFINTYHFSITTQQSVLTRHSWHPSYQNYMQSKLHYPIRIRSGHTSVHCNARTYSRSTPPTVVLPVLHVTEMSTNVIKHTLLLLPLSRVVWCSGAETLPPISTHSLSRKLQ